MKTLTGVFLAMIVPVGRVALSVVACEAQVAQIYRYVSPAVFDTCNVTKNYGGQVGYDCDCSKFEQHIIVMVIAILAALTYVIAVPLFLCCLIKKNKPHGTPERLTAARAAEEGHKVPDDVMETAPSCGGEITFDEDGEVVLFDRHRYLKAVQMQVAGSNPYAGLYEGFEQKWAGWKILVTIVKLILVAPTILLWKFPIVQTAVMVGISLFFALINTIAGPYVSTITDEMQASATWSSFASLFIGFIPVLVAVVANPNGVVGEQASATIIVGTICGILLNIVQVTHLLFSMTGIVWGCDCARTTYKKCSGRIDAYSTVLDVRGRHDAVVRSWDIPRELKHRLWHPFWNSLLLKKCGDEVAGRMIELMAMTTKFGIKRIKDHWANAESDADVRLFAIHDLEGVDVYATSDIAVPIDGTLDSKTCFGKMYVERYPYRCVVVYDDAADATFVHSDHVRALVELNQRPDIVEQRGLREDIRGCSGKLFTEPAQRMVTKTEQDGTDTVTYQVSVSDGNDADGNPQSHMESRTKEEPHMHTFSTLISYQAATMSVGKGAHHAAENSEWSAGFAVQFTYNDGTGDYTLPRTGRHCHYQRESWARPGSDIGVGANSTFSRNATIDRILNNNRANGWEQGRNHYKQHVAAYRKELDSEYRELEAKLSPAFWFKVYNNMQITMHECKRYLEKEETNVLLTSVPTEHAASLKFLFSKVAFTQRHPACAFWWCFWDDLWNANKEIGAIANNATILDSGKPNSIAYRPMPRAKLEEELNAAGLIGSSGWCGDRFTLCCKAMLIDDRVMTTLYNGMEAFTNGTPFEQTKNCATLI